MGKPNQLEWIGENVKTLPLYDVERTTRKLQCADNPDGTSYATHQLSPAHWKAIPGMRSMYAPWVELVLLLEHGFKVTSSLVLPLIPSLYARTAQDQPFFDVDTEEALDNVPRYVLEGREVLHKELGEKFFADMDISKVEDFALATVLDPRFKNLDFPGLTLWDDGGLTKAEVYKWLRGAWNDPLKSWRPRSSSEGATADAGQAPPPPPAAKRMRPSGLLAFALETPAMPVAHVTSVPDELDTYLSLPQASYVGTDVLQWWREHQGMLPNLTRMARQYLAKPASSASIERVFSRAGRYHNDLKKSTKDTSIETLLMVALNIDR